MATRKKKATGKISKPARQARRQAVKTVKPGSTRTNPRAARPTKMSVVIDLLKGERGASIAALMKSTGWQAHSVRAALTGLRKKGHALTRTKGETGVSRYRIDAGGEHV